MADLQHCDVDIEMIGIKIKIPFTRDIYILNIYRPPSGNIENFIKKNQTAIITIRSNGRNEILLGGDINVDMLRTNSINAKKIQKFTRIAQMKQLIQKITRPDSSTCLDLIFTDSDIIKEFGIQNLNISDHLPVFCIRKKTRMQRHKTEFYGRSYRNLDRKDYFFFSFFFFY